MTRPYTYSDLAVDRRSLARLRRHDDRVSFVKHVLAELVVKAVVPAVLFALTVAILHPY